VILPRRGFGSSTWPVAKIFGKPIEHGVLNQRVASHIPKPSKSPGVWVSRFRWRAMPKGKDKNVASTAASELNGHLESMHRAPPAQ